MALPHSTGAYTLLDGLTGAWNRRYLEHAMPAEMSRSRRYRQPLSAALIDIDHFRRINDCFGQATGDAVLRELAGLLRRRVRAANALVRWAGEEFLVLMPCATHGAAAAAAEALRATVCGHAFAAVGHLTVSVGAGELLAGEDGGRFFQRLDAALYRAKSLGRDRVELDARGASDAWAKEAPAGVVQLVWSERYACGEPLIDAQHQELFRLANALIYAGLDPAHERVSFLAALERCLEHIARHFTDEEGILAARGYAGLEQHRAAHRALLGRAQALKRQVTQDEAGIGALLEFLANEVVMRHLLGADREFFPLMQTG